MPHFGKFSKAQLIIWGSVGILSATALLLILFGYGGKTEGTSANLTVWGFTVDQNLRDPMLEIIDSYKSTHPDIRITLVAKDPRTYVPDLLNALASGKGPDIFFLDDTQILQHQDKIAPLPSGALVYTPDTFRADFADIFADKLVTKNNEIIGLPMYLDTLALFYNKDYLNSANIAAPAKTWDEFAEQVRALTVVGSDNELQRSGVALGLANVEYFTDIVSAFFMQTGDTVYNRTTGKIELEHAATPLDFYASFAIPEKKNYTWSLAFKDSFNAFSDEKTVMVIGYASDIARLYVKNPHLNFGVAPLPQIQQSPVRVNFGRYQFAAVSRLSKNPTEAWRFLLSVTDRVSSKKYLTAHRLPPARRDLIAASPEQLLTPFYGQVLSAKNWLRPDREAVDAIFKEMIESVTARRFNSSSAVSTAKNRLDLLFNTFNGRAEK